MSFPVAEIERPQVLTSSYFGDNWFNALMAGGLSMEIFTFLNATTIDWAPVILGVLTITGMLGRVAVTWIQARARLIEAQAHNLEAEADLADINAERARFELERDRLLGEIGRISKELSVSSTTPSDHNNT